VGHGERARRTYARCARPVRVGVFLARLRHGWPAAGVAPASAVRVESCGQDDDREVAEHEKGPYESGRVRSFDEESAHSAEPA